MLSLLGRQLMQPELVIEFLVAYKEELWRSALDLNAQAGPARAIAPLWIARPPSSWMRPAMGDQPSTGDRRLPG